MVEQQKVESEECFFCVIRNQKRMELPEKTKELKTVIGCSHS